MTLTRGVQKLVTVFFIFAVLAAGFIFYLYPKQKEETASAERELELLKQQKKQLERFASLHKNAADDVKRMGKQEKIVSGLLPKQMDSASFLTSLQQWSWKSGVKIKKILPGDEKSFEAYKEQQIVVSASGTYFEWLDFLYLLEQDGRFTDIREMQGKTDKYGQFDGTVMVYIFSSVS